MFNVDGVVKSPIYCVAVFFQSLGILYVCLFAPEKPLRLVYGTFNLAIFSMLRDFLRVHQRWTFDVGRSKNSLFANRLKPEFLGQPLSNHRRHHALDVSPVPGGLLDNGGTGEYPS